MGVSRCSSDYARLLSVARLTVCIYMQGLTWCVPYFNVVNLLTVTKINMIRRNALWLCTDNSCENTAPSLPQCCAAVLAALELSRSTAQRSQQLLMSPADLRRDLRSSKIWLLYKSNPVASWMRLHYYRCFQEHLRMLLQSLRAHCVAPGRSGSI